MIICCYCFAVCGWWFFFGYAVCWLPICWPYIDHNELCLSKLKHCICSPYFYSFVVLFVCVYRTHMIVSMFEDTICFNFRWANMEHKTTWEPKWTEFRQNFGSQYYQLMSINQLATCRRKLCNYVAIQITSSSSYSHIVSFASSQQLSSSQQLKKKKDTYSDTQCGLTESFPLSELLKPLLKRPATHKAHVTQSEWLWHKLRSRHQLILTRLSSTPSHTQNIHFHHCTAHPAAAADIIFYGKMENCIWRLITFDMSDTNDKQSWL